jgi:hypothetical protein
MSRKLPSLIWSCGEVSLVQLFLNFGRWSLSLKPGIFDRVARGKSPPSLNSLAGTKRRNKCLLPEPGPHNWPPCTRNALFSIDHAIRALPMPAGKETRGGRETLPADAGQRHRRPINDRRRLAFSMAECHTRYADRVPRTLCSARLAGSQGCCRESGSRQVGPLPLLARHILRDFLRTAFPTLLRPPTQSFPLAPHAGRYFRPPRPESKSW